MEYFISKLSFRFGEKFIDNVIVYEYDGQSLNFIGSKDRNWLVNIFNKGFKISTLSRTNSVAPWIRGSIISYNNNLFSWDRQLPLNIGRRKTFVSYYHNEDQKYKEIFHNLFEDLIVIKSVQDGDIDSNNGDEYIKKLIQKNHLEDTTILIVLIGLNTKHRKHIDWEISGALNLKVGERYSGLLGIKLPNHPDYGTGRTTYGLIPGRLADNFRSHYAVIRDWTDDRVKMQEYIELAFNRRNTDIENIDNSRIQMKENTNE